MLFSFHLWYYHLHFKKGHWQWENKQWMGSELWLKPCSFHWTLQLLRQMSIGKIQHCFPCVLALLDFNFQTINLSVYVLPLISSSTQWDFFPFAASSEDIIVYILRGSGGSYFSLGMPVETRKETNQYMKESNSWK